MTEKDISPCERILRAQRKRRLRDWALVLAGLAVVLAFILLRGG